MVRVVMLWKVIAIIQAQLELTAALSALEAWQRNTGHQSLPQAATRDTKWAKWVCDCLDSKNGKNPFMLD